MICRTLREIFATIAGYRDFRGMQTAKLSQVRAETRSPDVFTAVRILQLDETPGLILDSVKHYSAPPYADPIGKPECSQVNSASS